MKVDNRRDRVAGELGDSPCHLNRQITAATHEIDGTKDIRRQERKGHRQPQCHEEQHGSKQEAKGYIPLHRSGPPSRTFSDAALPLFMDTGFPAVKGLGSEDEPRELAGHEPKTDRHTDQKEPTRHIDRTHVRIALEE